MTAYNKHARRRAALPLMILCRTNEQPAGSILCHFQACTRTAALCVQASRIIRFFSNDLLLARLIGTRDLTRAMATTKPRLDAGWLRCRPGRLAETTCNCLFDHGLCCGSRGCLNSIASGCQLCSTPRKLPHLGKQGPKKSSVQAFSPCLLQIRAFSMDFISMRPAKKGVSSATP